MTTNIVMLIVLAVVMLLGFCYGSITAHWYGDLHPIAFGWLVALVSGGLFLLFAGVPLFIVGRL